MIPYIFQKIFHVNLEYPHSTDHMNSDYEFKYTFINLHIFSSISTCLIMELLGHKFQHPPVAFGRPLMVLHVLLHALGYEHLNLLQVS